MGKNSRAETAEIKQEMEDPVCGMDGSPRIQSRFMGAVFFFCSDACREKFDSDPEIYLQMDDLERK